MKVLIVEDDPMVAQINRQYLEPIRGIEVVGLVENGREALAFVKENSVDLIILDVYMPHVNGLELLTEMRRSGLEIDVIMVTAANEARHIDESLRLGVVDYLVKPFTEVRFKEAIKKWALKKQILHTTDVLSQDLIDRMVGIVAEPQEPAVHKGMQQATLATIMDALREKPGAHFTCDELASRIGLSKVTIRRYLNHLVEERLAESTIDYDTGGRPSVRYALKTGQS
ncbi:MAG: response regulator [Planctomycetaceae bacterium]|nr:response regulator [Planctomycetaceae bacterium]